MKRYSWLLICVVCVTAFILVRSVTAVSSLPSPTPDSADAKRTVPVEYSLPYPGMLPDHPLYILKTVRDKIMEFLISDPIRKIEFYILQSDKYVNAGVLLIDQQKETLAKSAFSAANAYKKQAVTLSDTLGKQGGMLPQYISERLGKSLMKQEEVITSIAERIPQSYKEVFVGFISVIHGIQEEFSKIQ